jgi:hypothetical protein
LKKTNFDRIWKSNGALDKWRANIWRQWKIS